MSAVVLQHKNQIQAVFKGNYSEEYLTGIVIGLMTLLYQEAGPNPHYSIQMGSMIFTLTDRNAFISTISEFLLIEGVDPVNIIPYSAKLPNNNMGWWIRALTTDFRFNLYRFTSQDFISGFISAFKPFKMDFRDFIVGPPFIYDSNRNQIQPLIVEGYQIRIFDGKLRVPSSIMPYETMTYITGLPIEIN